MRAGSIAANGLFNVTAAGVLLLDRAGHPHEVVTCETETKLCGDLLRQPLLKMLAKWIERKTNPWRNQKRKGGEAVHGI